ncbi:MAG: ACP S-malonyltransferase [Anaerolineae bacterium]|nr:ACP S-malonyltransferase [Anaerolineae bacterium]
MGQAVYEHDPRSRAVFDQADAQLGYPLSALCFQGPEEKLTDTVHQQPALLVTSVATWAAMQGRGWDLPAYAAGHSLGEFSALVVAGALTFADGLALVQRRGELMKQAGEREPGAMAAVLGLDIPQLEMICSQASEMCGRPVQVANDNCPGQVVISGDGEALTQAMTLAQVAGAKKVVQLPITIAAHSALMGSAAADFAHAVDNTPIISPRIPVIGNVSAQPLYTPDQIRTELKAQLTNRVRWTETVQYLAEQAVGRVIEVGPGEVLRGLVKRIDRRIERIGFELS